jgi:hypothetical protein
VQAYPDSLLCTLVDDSASDGAVLARSSGRQRKPIAIDRDPTLFRQVLVTSLINTPISPTGLPDAEALWAELDFFGLLPQKQGGELSVSKGKRTMLPAAVLRHESARNAAAKAILLATSKALITKSNTESVSLIVSQMSELVSRKLLTGAQATQTLSDSREAVLRAANLEGTDWWKPFEQRLSLAPVPPASASDTQQSFVVVTGEDGRPQVLCVDNPLKHFPAECANRPPKELPAELQTLLETHLHALGFAVTLRDHSYKRRSVRFTLITVSWK